MVRWELAHWVFEAVEFLPNEAMYSVTAALCVWTAGLWGVGVPNYSAIKCSNSFKPGLHSQRLWSGRPTSRCLGPCTRWVGAWVSGWYADAGSGESVDEVVCHMFPRLLRLSCSRKATDNCLSSRLSSPLSLSLSLSLSL